MVYEGILVISGDAIHGCSGRSRVIMKLHEYALTTRFIHFSYSIYSAIISFVEKHLGPFYVRFLGRRIAFVWPICLIIGI